MHNLRFKNLLAVVAIPLLLFVFSYAHAQTGGSQYNSPIGPSQTPGQTVSGQTLNQPSNDTQAPYTLLTPLPCSTSLGTPCNGTDQNGNQALTSISLQQFISYLYKFMIALAVVLAVFMLTFGGFEYMMSEAITSKSDAVERMRNAVFGLLLALCTYLILYTIDPGLVDPNNLTIPPISSVQTATGTFVGGGGTFNGTGAGGSF